MCNLLVLSVRLHCVLAPFFLLLGSLEFHEYMTDAVLFPEDTTWLSRNYWLRHCKLVYSLGTVNSTKQYKRRGIRACCRETSSAQAHQILTHQLPFDKPELHIKWALNHVASVLHSRSVY